MSDRVGEGQAGKKRCPGIMFAAEYAGIGAPGCLWPKGHSGGCVPPPKKRRRRRAR